MEGDTKKLIFLGLFTGLGCFGIKYFAELLQDYNEKQKKIIKQGSPHTPLSLLKKKKDDIGEQGEYMMVSGICIKEKNHDKDQIEALLSNIRTDSKLYKVVYRQDLESSKFRAPTYENSIPIVNQFRMVDPIDQENQYIIVAPGSYAQGLNLKHKRVSKTDYSFINKRQEWYEKLTLVAYEGSSLTLMGLVKYDKALGCFKMTEVGGFIAGGVSECKKMI